MSDMTDSSANKPFYLTQNTGFAQIRPEDDLLHPASFANVKEDSATETQYFGFSVPEANIHALCYMWHHPNLRVCSGGLFVFQGVKEFTLQAELHDWRSYMSDAALKNDLREFRFDNGYGVKTIEPLKRFHLTYAAPANRNSVDLMIEAVLPAVMFGDGNHFEQTMQVKGELVLRGKRYDVDCFTVRDRSWGKARHETPLPMAPVSWMCGAFSKDFSFNCQIFDHVGKNPGPLALPDAKALSGGWVHRDGKLGRIVRASKRALREPGSTACAGIEMQFSDEHGREFDLRGALVASCPVAFWNNIWIGINLMQWECDGQTGYGDNQEAFWNDYLNSSTFKQDGSSRPRLW